MYIKQFSCALLLLFALHAQSQLLWSIEKKGLQKTSYLYGTMHQGDSSIIAWDAEFMDLFYSCELFMGELDLTQSEQMSDAMKYLTQLAMRDSNEVVSKSLADSIAIIEQKIADELDPETAKQMVAMKPIVALLQHSVLKKIKNGNLNNPISSSIKADQTVMPDWVLTEKAQAAGINVRGLETPEDQINALFKIPEHVQWKALYDGLVFQDTTAGDSAKNDLAQLIKAYKNQDLKKLNEFIDDQEIPKEIARELIIVRNYNMLAGIEDILPDQESVFFAVGAGHLGGKEGLIALLQERGYELKPVPFVWEK